MPLPLLEYAPKSQNQRVAGFEIPGDEQPKIYTTEDSLKSSEMDALIMAAYRQIGNEQQMLDCYRQRTLESQLRSQQITVQQFIRGLVLSDSFRQLVYESNNNYRFAEICIQRILGRNPYSDREKIAWSIVLATKGLTGFVDELLNSEEYLSNFGENTVPYQRRRILPQCSKGELPFSQVARYGTDYRDKLPKPSRGGAWMGKQNADSLFDQDEQFDFQTFIDRSDWSRVAALLVPISGIIVFMLGFSIVNQ